MMQVPWFPFVTATGRPNNSGWSSCSIDAKNEFISTNTIIRGQGKEFLLLVASKLPNDDSLNLDTLGWVYPRFHKFVFWHQ